MTTSTISLNPFMNQVSFYGTIAQCVRNNNHIVLIPL